MSNTGFLTLGLLDVRGQEAADPDTRVDVVQMGGAALRRFAHLGFPPRQRMEIEAFPQAANLRCEARLARYRHCQTGFFTLNDGQELSYNLTVVRRPEEWQARFLSWTRLPAHFAPLKKVLNDSIIQTLGGEPLGKFTEGNYDEANAEQTVLAKAAMLNLFAKLMTPEPVSGAPPWFLYVRQLLAIGRERCFAIVAPEMGKLARNIYDNIGQFDHYARAHAGNHYAALQAALPDFRIFKSKMFSVKTDERHANLQLTLAPAQDPTGADVFVLDADIDEHGDLLNHLIDVALLHPVNGGTHPFDIHEYLLRADRNLQLGYELI